MTWTQENISKMETLKLQGLSASKIARQIGTTKNAVIGILYRAKLKNGHVATRQNNIRDSKFRSSYFPKTGEKRKCNTCLTVFDMRSRFDRFCWRCKYGINNNNF